MRHSVRDYLRAFLTAVRMTARGEQPPALKAEAHFSPFFAWCAQTVALADAVIAEADARGIDTKRRAALKLRIEGRLTSFEIALAAVRFHSAQEFPYLLRHEPRYALLGLHATNLNDRFLLLRFAESGVLPAEVTQTLQALIAHLERVPQEPESSAAEFMKNS